MMVAVPPVPPRPPVASLKLRRSLFKVSLPPAS